MRPCIAKFIGRTDPKIGIVNGRNYTVQFLENRVASWQIDLIIYFDEIYEAPIKIPYDTMSALVKNWDFRRP